MQTFLPDKSFRKSAQILDNKRLGKQRIEARQILEILVEERLEFMTLSKSRWRNHPAVRLWEHKEKALSLYGVEMCLEWKARGYKDNQLFIFCREYYRFHTDKPDPYPDFSEALYSSHRAALFAKNPEYYKQFGWREKPVIDYVWR